jgi:hypothetical protein
MIRKEPADAWCQRLWTVNTRSLVVSVGVAMFAWLWALGLLLCTPRTMQAQEEVKNPVEGDAQAIQEGFLLFQGLCVPCMDLEPGGIAVPISRTIIGAGVAAMRTSLRRLLPVARTPRWAPLVNA